MLLTLLFLLFAVILLYGGARLLVYHGAGLAKKLGVSALIIGLTIIAIGTSVPELFVSIASVLDNVPLLSVGNLLGASIFVISGVLGIAALISPTRIRISSIQNELPFLIVGSLLLFLLSIDGTLSGIDGAVLLCLLCIYFYNTFHTMKQDDQHVLNREVRTLLTSEKKRTHLVLLLIGIVAVAIGARLMVTSATGIARNIGISDLIIGITLVSFGTTLPELVTAIVAATKHQDDLELGTLIGSALLNTLGILAILAIMTPLAIPDSVLYVYLPFFFVLSVMLYPLLKRDFVINRIDAVLLIGFYIIFLINIL